MNCSAHVAVLMSLFMHNFVGVSFEMKLSSLVRSWSTSGTWKKKKTAHAIQYILHLILQDYEYFLCLETNYTLKKNY